MHFRTVIKLAECMTIGNMRTKLTCQVTSAVNQPNLIHPVSVVCWPGGESHITAQQIAGFAWCAPAAARSRAPARRARSRLPGG